MTPTEFQLIVGLAANTTRSGFTMLDGVEIVSGFSVYAIFLGFLFIGETIWFLNWIREIR